MLLLLLQLLLSSASAQLAAQDVWIEQQSPAMIASPSPARVDFLPRYSWAVAAAPANARGWVQAAYQIRVVRLVTGATAWDSGQVAGNATLFVPHPSSAPLVSGAGYTVAVRVWCGVVAGGNASCSDGPGAWSAPVAFRTALLGTDSPLGNVSSPLWNGADWVVPNGSVGASATPLMLRGLISLEALNSSVAIAAADLHWVGLGYGEAWVEGYPAEDASAASPAPTTPINELWSPPGDGWRALGDWTVWTRRVLYRSSDVTAPVAAAVARGQTSVALGVLLAPGQYAGQWGGAWSPVPHSTPPLVLRAVLTLELAATGQVVTVPLRAANVVIAPASPVVTAGVYAGETYSTALEVPGFSSSKSSSTFSTWSPATSLSGPWAAVLGSTALRASAFAPIRWARTPPRPAVAMWASSTDNTSYVFDLGANFVGVARVRLPALPAGATPITLTISKGEQLQDSQGVACVETCAPNATGDVYYPYRGQNDRVTMGSSDAGRWWQPRFVYAGFRFVQISGWPSTVMVEGRLYQVPAPQLGDVVAPVARSDVLASGDAVFASSDGSWPAFQSTASILAGDAAASPEAVGSLAGALNSFLQRSMRALASNMHSVMSDCPTRERVGWTGDAAATLTAAALRLNMRAFHAKWLGDMVQSQASDDDDDGSLPSTIPFAKHHPPVDPSWPTVFPQLAHQTLTMYEDVATAQALFRPVRAYVESLAAVTSCSACESDGCPLVSRDGLPIYWMNGDWMQNRPMWPGVAFSGAFFGAGNYIRDVSTAARLAALAGDTTGATRLAAVAANATVVFNELFQVNSSRGHESCDESIEARQGGRNLWLRCPDGGVITNLTAAYWGTPTGTCATDNLAPNASCDSTTFAAAAAKQCIGQPACYLETSTDAFGDPCPQTMKRMAVEVQCNGLAPPAELSPIHYGGGEGETALALEAGFVPAELQSGVRAGLAWLVQARGNVTWTGFLGNRVLLDALDDGGRDDLALAVATSTATPSFGKQALLGLTSLSENWSGVPDDTNANSPPTHNHHFMGGWAAWVVQRAAGLGVSDEVGWSLPRLGPSPAMWTMLPSGAAAWHQSPRGNVSLAWSGHDLSVTIPPNTAAQVVLPPAASITESGALVFRSGTFQPGASPGVLAGAIDPPTGQVVLQVTSGVYKFAWQV